MVNDMAYWSDKGSRESQGPRESGDEIPFKRLPRVGENVEGFYGDTGAPVWCSKCKTEVSAQKFEAHFSH
ncbi:hypothetical protein CASFOL_015870 [Castilleja foliolosa]|uniref:Uncharacterized protein n=1 Tax=Castilleja foliolosa TaxID=1961234 RepID=A0ABD3DFW1_9LAMI